MNVARSAGEVLAEHTTLELKCIDRMYLNVDMPMLQEEPDATAQSPCSSACGRSGRRRSS